MGAVQSLGIADPELGRALRPTERIVVGSPEFSAEYVTGQRGASATEPA